MLLIFSNKGVCRSQDVLAGHCIEKTHEVVIPFDIVFFTGSCPVSVEGFPQLWHALHTWTVGVQCLGNHGQSNGCHLQQFAVLHKDCAYDIIVRPLANCFLRFRKTVPRGSGADLQKLQEYRLERCAGISSSIFCRHSPGEPSRLLNTEGSSHVLQSPRRKNRGQKHTI